MNDGSESGHLSVGSHAAHLRQKFVRCGKPGCTKCPHGPYTYLSYRVGSTVKTQYVGRSADTRKSGDDEKGGRIGF
jgi:hypothetical protein